MISIVLICTSLIQVRFSVFLFGNWLGHVLCSFLFKVFVFVLLICNSLRYYAQWSFVPSMHCKYLFLIWDLFFNIVLTGFYSTFFFYNFNVVTYYQTFRFVLLCLDSALTLCHKKNFFSKSFKALLFTLSLYSPWDIVLWMRFRWRSSFTFFLRRKPIVAVLLTESFTHWCV